MESLLVAIKDVGPEWLEKKGAEKAAREWTFVEMARRRVESAGRESCLKDIWKDLWVAQDIFQEAMEGTPPYGALKKLDTTDVNTVAGNTGMVVDWARNEAYSNDKAFNTRI